MLQAKKMLWVWHCLLITHLVISPLQASFENQNGGWLAASANIGVVGPAHINRFKVNPSLMHMGVRSQVGIQYSKPFNGLDLHSSSLLLASCIQNIPLIIAADYFGDEVYSESTMSIGASWSIDSTFRGGLTMGIFHISIPGFQTFSTATLSPSLYFELADDLHIGSVIHNFLQVKESFQVPQKFSFGLEYDSGPILALVSIEKEAALPLELCYAITTSPERKWQLAAGYRSLSKTVSAGWRLGSDKYALHYSWVSHKDLPHSHGFGLEIFFK